MNPAAPKIKTTESSVSASSARVAVAAIPTTVEATSRVVRANATHDFGKQEAVIRFGPRIFCWTGPVEDDEETKEEWQQYVRPLLLVAPPISWRGRFILLVATAVQYHLLIQPIASNACLVGRVRVPFNLFEKKEGNFSQHQLIFLT